MGKLVYVPDVISIEDLEKRLLELKELCLKVDDDVTRSVLNEACAELHNEVDNINKGYRNPAD